jgi:SARP family transcriptional regulator, regulator of embCAB operon
LDVRLQLCGRLVVRIGGERRELMLRGGRGVVLLGYLALHRGRTVARDELIEALWPQRPPPAADASLRSLLSKLRGALGHGLIEGRSELRLVLPADAWLDFEAADESIHRAESAVARQAWTEGWAPAHIALNVSRRMFLGHVP